MILLLLFINIDLILCVKEIEYVSQHSLIDLKNYYISYLEKYGFAISNNQNGNLILQPFQNIEYFYLCTDINQVYIHENNCDKINNITGNKDNFLGLYSQYDSLYFLFNTSEYQMKYFFDKAPINIDIDNDSNFKCFDFFSGYDNLQFNLNSNLSYNRMGTFQFMTNETGNNYNSILYLIGDRPTWERYYFYQKSINLVYSYNLSFYIKYSLHYSPPRGDNIHSMLCLSFRNDKEHLVTADTKVIPLIAPGYYNFSSYLEKEWNISSEYYPTTFYFYSDSATIQNCSFRVEILNHRGDSGSCKAKKDDSVDNLYTIKIYSSNDSTITFTLFLEPKMIDENCHFGYNISFNKTVSEYDPISHFTEILEEIMALTVVIFTLILIVAAVVTFFTPIGRKCNCKCVQ